MDDALVGERIYEITGMENGYAFVDLGLSVKWAAFNVGATKLEEYGDYFAWGEVESKDNSDWRTYKHCNGSARTMTKYCTHKSYGAIDNKAILESEDDAATVNWGGAWRMPTKAELDELWNNCTWSWTTQNGVEGYKVKGINGNSFFLPAAGYMSDGRICHAGTYGGYWSSSLYTRDPVYAYIFILGSDEGCDNSFRNGLSSVRPVCP